MRRPTRRRWRGFRAWTWSSATRRSIGWSTCSAISASARARRSAWATSRTSRGVPVAPLARRSGRSRAFVKIQDGCQHRCAFCIVPAARGGSRSQEPDVVREQVEALVDAGYREITLTGVDIGHYGRDLTPRTSLAALVARLGEVPGLRWLRLSSVLPAYWSDELIEAVTGTPRGGAPPAPAASERQRPRAAAHAPSVQSADVPRARGAAGRGHPRPRPRHRPHRGPSRRGGRRLRGDAARGRGAAALVPARVPVLRPEGDRGGGPGRSRGAAGDPRAERAGQGARPREEPGVPPRPRRPAARGARARRSGIARRGFSPGSPRTTSRCSSAARRIWRGASPGSGSPPRARIEPSGCWRRRTRERQGGGPGRRTRSRWA